MVSTLAISGSISFAALAAAKEWHFGAAFGSPFDVTTDCADIDNISPELLINWGPDNRHDATINVCNNTNIKFLPYLWGQTWDDSELNALPNDDAPWAVIFENEPNWWGGEPLTDDHGDGCNMTATAAAAKYSGHTQIINEKWGVGVVKLISPSPVNKYYPMCMYEPEQGCAFQTQMDWLAEYFANCGTCEQDIWAINIHDYNCNLADTQSLVADMAAAYPGKNVFFGELGCNGPTAEEMAQYLLDFSGWAYQEDTVRGFIWAAITNDVGTPGSELSTNGQLTPVGQAFKQIQQQYPPDYNP
ncbi:hypothetical protein CONPUDRAFT_152702 [Coniophora puteana RWD-64-598 SS2]|uniref:Asl1-like glycosyl hydrolase catalytic domain-containing protein n=1 Tax=Coniophora puteana (strain RWD-64-598) TaxID=741705 RepID=A0A5M3MRL0_CONPW|nr:uncharacterized protein CONPUDRAFT_152702 [Coniophora puteana RWD-64-598 SS2]EIW81798.1 hypothetical protein CONPUDRAFT_152702 [Coniophora puteana RWD-64-598 SS2]